MRCTMTLTAVEADAISEDIATDMHSGATMATGELKSVLMLACTLLNLRIVQFMDSRRMYFQP